MIDLTGIRARLADYQRQLDIRQSVALHSDEWGHAQMLAEEYAEFLANAMPAVLARVDELTRDTEEYRAMYETLSHHVAVLRDSPQFEYEPHELGGIAGEPIEVVAVAQRVLLKRQARIAELGAALRPFVDSPPVYYNTLTYHMVCIYCGAGGMREETIDHEDDCAWIRAMAVLGGDA